MEPSSLPAQEYIKCFSLSLTLDQDKVTELEIGDNGEAGKKIKNGEIVELFVYIQ